MSSDEKGKKEDAIEQTTVAPTDMVATDIENFGQENIPFYIDSNKGSNKFNYNITKTNSDDINIGITPTGILTEKPKKKKIIITKTMFIIIIAVVIGLIGFGIYFFLSQTKTIATFAVKTKDLEISIGSKLPLNLDEYATFNGVNPTNCYLVTAGVKTDSLGKYNYSIMCGSNEYKGKITVVDNKAPDVVTKIAVKHTTDDIKVDDFIAECQDNSQCIKILDNVEDLIISKSSPGVYTANITVKDDIGNSRSVKEYLLVEDDNYKLGLNCSYSRSSTNAIDGFYKDYNYFLFNKDDVAYKMLASKKYYFNDKEEFNKFKEQIQDGKLELDGFNGEAFVDEDESSITIKAFQNIEEQLLFVTDYKFESINKFYRESGYECQNLDYNS